MFTILQSLTRTDAKNRRKASTMVHNGQPSPQQGNDINQKKLRFYLQRDTSNNSLLHAAAFSGNVVICSELLAAGLAPNEMNDLALTPLHIAAIRGHAHCLNILAQSLRNSTNSAIPELSASVLQALLLIPEANTSRDHLKALIVAISHLSAGGDIDEQLHNGISFAHAAILANRGDLVEVLADLKAKSCTPASGFTSIVHVCAFYNRPRILSMLNSKGVDCNCVDSHQRTPFHICIINGSADAAVALVQMGRYLSRAKDDFGLTAVNYLTVSLLKTAHIERASLVLDLSKHQAMIDTVLRIVKICPEVLLDPLPCGISIFHLLATDSSSKVVDLLQQFSSAVGEVVFAMPTNPFDSRIVPMTPARRSDQSAIASATLNRCSRVDNTIWIQPFCRPGDTPAMVAVRCCNAAALGILIQFASNPNKRCSCRSPLAQSLQPRLQQQQKHCTALAEVLLVHPSGGFSDILDAKIVAAAVARYAGLYKNLLMKPSPLLEKLKSYKAFTSPACRQFRRNAMCEIFLRQPLETIQQVISVMHSGNFVQVHPEHSCDLNGNSILHHIFMNNRSESHILGLWSLCISMLEPSALEQLAGLRNNRGKGLLHKICRFGSIRTIQVVLRALFSQSIIDYSVLFNIPKRSDCSPFSRALKYGNIALVQFLLSLDISSRTFEVLDDAVLSQTFDALRGPKNLLKQMLTSKHRSLCLQSLRHILQRPPQLEQFSLQEKNCFRISLKRVKIKNLKFEFAEVSKTEFPAIEIQTDSSEISNMFKTIPCKQSGLFSRIMLSCKPIALQCSQHQLKISQSWEKIDDLLLSMNDAASNFDSTALSFNSQKCVMQLAQLPDPSNVFSLSVVWFSMSNIISNILCHQAARLENDMTKYNFSADFSLRLRFLIEIGQDAPCFCRPAAQLLHRILDMELEAVDAFIASQVSINETAARVFANSTSILETFSVYIKCLKQGHDFFSNLSHFVLERLSVFMNQENATSESLLAACSKIPSLLFSHVQCTYLMSMIHTALSSIGLSDELLQELMLDSENMQVRFKTILSSELRSYGTWKSAHLHSTPQSSSEFVHIDFKECIFCTNGLDMLQHLVCRSSALNPRDLEIMMREINTLLVSKSPSTDAIEHCITLISSEKTGKMFQKEDSRRISYLCATAKQFQNMKTIIDQTFASIDICERLIRCDSFCSASESLSSIKNSLADFDVFERVMASKVSELESSCVLGTRAKEHGCDQMLRDATRVLADATGLSNTIIFDVEFEVADVVKFRLQEMLLRCNEFANLLKQDACIPHSKQPWSKVPSTLERLNSALSSVLQIIDDVQRFMCSEELLRICRIFEGKGVLLLPSSVIQLSFIPLNLGPLLPNVAQIQVDNILKGDLEFCKLLLSDANILENWMSESSVIATKLDSTSHDLIDYIFKLKPIQEAILARLRNIIDIDVFNGSGAIEVRADCVDVLKTYFKDSDSCDAIINSVTQESSQLFRVLSCVLDSSIHNDNLIHHCERFKALEIAKKSKGLKSRITALNSIIELELEREREEAAVKIQRIARGKIVRRLSRVEAASIISGSKAEFKRERQCSVRHAFLSKIFNEILENVHRLLGLHDVKYRYEPSIWRAQYIVRCQAEIKHEKQLFSNFFSVCQQLDRDASTFENLDETALKAAELRISEIHCSYCDEDWTVARGDFFIDINSIESKLRDALRLCMFEVEVFNCISKLRAAQMRVRHALECGNHLLALHEASSNWTLDPYLSSSKSLLLEVELLRNSVAESVSKISADKEHLDKLAQSYKLSLHDVVFHMEQSQYESAHRFVAQARSDLDKFKAHADLYSGLTVRVEDIPQVDTCAVSQLMSTLMIVAERDKAIEKLESHDYCIDGSFHESYVLINHVNSSLKKLDSRAHAILSGPLLHIQERVDDAVKLVFGELRRVAAAIRTGRADHLNSSVISMITSHNRLLAMTTLALEYSAKSQHIIIDDVSSHIKIPCENEINRTWWTTVQNQLGEEKKLLDALERLHCQYLKEIPAILTQNVDKHSSKLKFCRSSTSFIQHHLVPLTTACDSLPLPSLVSHVDVKVVVSELLAYIQNFISEFDLQSSSLLRNLVEMGELYSNSKRQLDTFVANAAEGNFSTNPSDIFFQIKDNFEKCELLVVRTNSLLDFCSAIELPIHSEHLRWFSLHAAVGIKAANQCHTFIGNVSVEDGTSIHPTSSAALRVSPCVQHQSDSSIDSSCYNDTS